MSTYLSAEINSNVTIEIDMLAACSFVSLGILAELLPSPILLLVRYFGRYFL